MLFTMESIFLLFFIFFDHFKVGRFFYLSYVFKFCKRERYFCALFHGHDHYLQFLSRYITIAIMALIKKVKVRGGRSQSRLQNSLSLYIFIAEAWTKLFFRFFFCYLFFKNIISLKMLINELILSSKIYSFSTKNKNISLLTNFKQ